MSLCNEMIRSEKYRAAGDLAHKSKGGEGNNSTVSSKGECDRGLMYEFCE